MFVPPPLIADACWRCDGKVPRKWFDFSWRFDYDVDCCSAVVLCGFRLTLITSRFPSAQNGSDLYSFVGRPGMG
jgi:hypothetical protein